MGFFKKLFGKKEKAVAVQPQFSQLPPPPEPMPEALAVLSEAPEAESEDEAQATAANPFPLLYLSSTPKYGDRTKDVATLQRRMTEKGFSTNGVDGVFKTDTLKAVQKLQKSIGLAGSGVIGVKTLAAINVEVQSMGLPVPAPSDESDIPSHETEGGGRDLEPELEAMIDRKCMELFPVDFPKAIKAKDGNLIVWMANRALLSYKVREKTNSNDGPMVVLIQKTIGGASKEAWCMAQQQTCIAFAEKKTGLTSTIRGSESVMTTATESPKNLVKLEDLQRGDIICWQHGKSWKGHTGNFDSWTSKLKTHRVIEGNTTSGSIGGAIVREGGGTYLCNRSVGKIGDMTVKSYLRPFPNAA